MSVDASEFAFTQFAVEIANALGLEAAAMFPGLAFEFCGQAQCTPQQLNALRGGPPTPMAPAGGEMGLVEDLLGGVTGVLNTVQMNLPTIATVAQLLGIGPQNGAMTPPINPSTGSPMPAMAAMASGSEAFLAACAAQPGCMDRLRMELAAMNGTTGSLDLNAAGIGGALSNPTLINLLRGLGLGAVVGAGSEIVGGAGSAIANLFTSNPRAGQGPLVMAWAAGTPYPRGIVLRAPDRPEKRYRTQGATLLSGGDVAAAKRVRKAAGRARRGTRRSPRNVTPIGISAHSVCGKCLTSPCVGGH